ncbi:hypothetical protein SKA53_06607 [Yoonia vestfoldensis SKA53]|uniref:Uncharacterized protein n=1 Tax=Yoonia vestfoldensis SKA53 TaxID=314232 RepID=A3V7V4_9RHOB|nr:hypothetical protein SKA53_06607 [Yoonia vestfoldensis SKA53]
MAGIMPAGSWRRPRRYRLGGALRSKTGAQSFQMEKGGTDDAT